MADIAPPYEIDARLLRDWPLPHPGEDADKEERGATLVLAGSREMPGTAVLAATAALRAGAGKLQIAAPDDIAVALGIAMPEAMVVGYATARDGGFSNRAVGSILERATEADVIVAGPGLTNNRAADRLAGKLCRAGKPVVTANKQLLAQHGDELFAVAREAGVQLRFEAAVAAVMPELGADDIVLVKASRGLALDTVAEEISGADPGPPISSEPSEPTDQPADQPNRPSGDRA